VSRAITAAIIILAFLVVHPLAVCEDIPLIDAADPGTGLALQQRRRIPGRQGLGQRRSQVVRDGKPSLRLISDLSAGGNYCDMSRDVAER
jgi:hypothetical protein